MPSHSRIATLLIAAVVLTGCGPAQQREPRKKTETVVRTRTLKQNKTGKTSPKSKYKTPENPRKAYSPPEVVAVAAATPDELKDFIAKKTGENRAVLVDFWATWCAPCKKAFPHTLELSKEHAKRGLVVVSVSMDDFEDRTAAEAYLKKNDARIINFISSDKVDPDKRFELFGIENSTIPHYHVYGPDGKIVAKISPTEPGEDESPDDAFKQFLSNIDEAVEKALGLR